MRIEHRIEEWKIKNYDETAFVFETQLQLTLLSKMPFVAKRLTRLYSSAFQGNFSLKGFYC